MAKKKPKSQTLRVKFFFNVAAGDSEKSPVQLAETLSAMQDHDIIPEVYVITKKKVVEQAVARAEEDGTDLIVASGGDGTVTRFARALVGTKLTLGIIPVGTRNNIAVSLGIPASIPDAVGLLRYGKRVKADVGKAEMDGKSRYFFEALNLGLMSEAHSAADHVQKGDLSRVGELVSTIVTSTPSKVALKFDGAARQAENVHVVVIANMPYIGANLHIAPDISYSDEMLDVFLFSDMSKAQLIFKAIQTTAAPLDDSVTHYRARKFKIEALPDMDITADGRHMGKGTLKVKVVPAALNVMAGIDRGRGPLRVNVPRLKKQENA